MKLHHTKKITCSSGLKDGYWYLSKHGIGPGTIPRDVYVDEVVNDGWDTYMLLSRMLTSEELDSYDLEERSPKEEFLSSTEIRGSDEWDDELDEEWDEEWDEMESFDRSRDLVVPEIEKALKVEEDIANIIYDWYDAEDAWEDFDSVPDFVHFMKTDIVNMCDACDDPALAAKVLYAVGFIDEDEYHERLEHLDDVYNSSTIDRINTDKDELEYVVSSDIESSSLINYKDYRIMPDSYLGGWQVLTHDYNLVKGGFANESLAREYIDNDLKSVHSSIDVTSDLGVDLIKLESEIKEGIKEYFASPQGGWPEDEVDQAVRDYTAVDIRNNYEGDAIVVEVRAELSYDGMIQMSEILDEVVQKYDPNAYFDMVTAGVMEAYIFKKGVVGNSSIEGAQYVEAASLDDERMLSQHERQWLEPEDYDDPEEKDDIITDFDFDIKVQVNNYSFDIVESDPLYHADILEDEGISVDEMLDNFNDLIAWHISNNDGIYDISGHAELVYEWSTRNEKYECNFRRSGLSNLEVEKEPNIISNTSVQGSIIAEVVEDSVLAKTVEVGDIIQIVNNDSELDKGTVVEILAINDPGQDWIDYTFRAEIVDAPRKSDIGSIVDIHYDSDEPVGKLDFNN